jgi:alpha-beta hydrolase superfamily lysophospholipase
MKSTVEKSKIAKSLLALAVTFIAAISSVNAQSLRRQESSNPLDAVIGYSIGDSGVQSVSNWPVKPDEQKAIVVALHGFGLHKSVYQSLAEKFQTAGISTYAMDIRGFGSWSKNGGLGVRFDPSKTLDDVDEVLVDLRAQNPTTPIFLMGESLGGAMALAEVARHPHLVDGVVASVPASERYKSKRTAFGLFFSNLSGRGNHVDIGQRLVNQATNDPDLKINWLHDANARLTVSTSELLTFSRFMHHNHKVADRIADRYSPFVQ